MDTRLQNLSKAPSPSSSPVQTGLFQSRPSLEPEQETTDAIDSSHQPPDLQTQLDTAARFGHNFSRVQVQSHTPTVIQQQPVNGESEEQQDEQESDSVAERDKIMAPPVGNPIQRKSFEEEPIQMMPQLGLLSPRLQRESFEEEPIQMKPQLGLLTPRLQRDSFEEEPIQMQPQLAMLQRLPQEEDESPIQMMPQLGIIQRQEAEVDEEPIQMQRIQLKVVVGQPGDKYEQEADSVAAQVMSMSAPAANPGLVQRQGEEEETDPLVQRSSLADSITPLVQRHTEEQEEQIQTKSLLQRAGANGNAEAGSNLENKLSSSKGGGSPLADDVRSHMEPRFGVDFSSVRVHTDSTAVQMNKDLHAQAFTHGSDIYYGSEKSPGNNELTAHELTHTIQQKNAVQPQLIDNKQRNHSQRQEEETENSTSEEAENSDLSASEGVKDDELVPEVPEKPSPFVVTEAAPQEPATDVSAVPTPNAEPTTTSPAVAASAGESITSKAAAAPESNMAVSESGTTMKQTMESQPVMEAPMLPVTDAVVPETQPEQIAASLDVSQIVADNTGEASTEEGRAIAATQADALIQESQGLAQNVASVGAGILESVKAQVAELTVSVHAKAEQARTDVTAVYTAQQEAVQAEVATTAAAIAQSREQQHEAIRAFAETERQRFDTAYQTEREGATAFIAEQKQQTLEAGESQAQRALTGTEERASAILVEADAISASGDPASVEAQQKATRRIAEDTAQKCRQAGSDLAQRVRQEATHHAGTYDELLQKYLQQLEQTTTDIGGSFDQFITSASSRVDTLAEQATTAAQEMGSQSAAVLESEKNAALAQIQVWQEQASGAVEQVGNQLQDPFTAQLSSFQEAIISYGANAAAQLRSVEQPDPNKVQEAAASIMQNMQESRSAAIAALEEWKGNTQTELTGQSENLNLQISELVGDHMTAAQDTGSQMIQALQEAAQNGATGMESSTASFQEKLTPSIDTAVEQMTSAGDQFRSQVQSTHQQAMSAFSQLVDEGLASEDNLIAKARQEMSSAVGQIGSKYEELKAEAEQRSASQEETSATRIQRSIWGDIWGAVTDFVDSVRKWFADTFGEFWGGLLFGILAGLVIVAVGWLALTGLGALLVACGVAAAKAAIIVLVVGLVIAIPLAIYNRFQEFYADNPGEDAGFWRGLGLVTLGILDLTGIPFIIEGLVGQRAFGKKLEGFERWERLGMGLVFLGAFLVSAKNLLRGKPKPQIEELPGTELSGTEPPGTEPPGTEPPGTKPPGTEPPGSEQPGQTVSPPRTLGELRSRLSEAGRAAFDQQRELFGEQAVEGQSRRFLREDGTYDVQAADEYFRNRQLTPDEYAQRLQAREQRAWADAESQIERVDNIIRETSPEGRPGATIGDGTSEAALTHEAQTGQPVGGRGHSQKVAGAVNGLSDAVGRLRQQLGRISDAGRRVQIEEAISRAEQKLNQMRPALDQWRNRVTDRPDIWNPDGTSNTYTNPDGSPWPPPNYR